MQVSFFFLTSVLTNYPNHQLVSEIRKYIMLQLNSPDDYEPITEQELEEVETFDPNLEGLSESSEEEEEYTSEEEEEKVQSVTPPPPRLHPVTQARKPKPKKMPPPKQRKPVKKIVKPSVHVAVHNVTAPKKK